MNTFYFGIPVPDSIPAPAWVFQFFDILLFTVHILLVNIILGGSLIALLTNVLRRGNVGEKSLQGPLTHRLPVFFALTVTMGVAPLLFVQVIYGHFFYTSSILMAKYWIAIIPLIIIAYYSAYIYIKSHNPHSMIAVIALVSMVMILFYIAFMFVNINLMSLQPVHWKAYLENHFGSILPLNDLSLFPRFLHFLTASIAMSGLAMAFFWNFRKKENEAEAFNKIKAGLLVFGIASLIQVFIGFWFLIALPRQIMLELLGGNMIHTLMLGLAICIAAGAIATAFSGKLMLTTGLSLSAVVLMVLIRDFVRMQYLQPDFEVSSLQITPQYSVLFLFLFVLVIGLASIVYMIKIGFQTQSGRVES